MHSTTRLSVTPACLVAVLLLTPGLQATAAARPTPRDEHLATAALVRARLTEAAVERDLSPLSNAELDDLATRATALEADPVAGGTRKTLVVTGIVVVAALLVLTAIAVSRLPE